MTVIPSDVEACRAALGEGFVRHFIERLEALGVDVVRIAELSTAYSFHINERPVIALPASGNWFRENFDLAHEFAHLALGHEGIMPGNAAMDAAELAASAFAAELLMPETEIRAIDWQSLQPSGLADLVWELGISTQALGIRLENLRIQTSDSVVGLLALKTQALLRRHWGGRHNGDPITERMAAASSRHFPEWLRHAHLERIATGAVHKDTLAWMLGIDPEGLEVDEPVRPDPPSDDDLLGLLG